MVKGVMGSKAKNDCTGKASSNLPNQLTGPQTLPVSHETEKYGHGSCEAQNKKLLGWRRPAANYQTRTGLHCVTLMDQPVMRQRNMVIGPNRA
jgi:hypothetical protein